MNKNSASFQHRLCYTINYILWIGEELLPMKKLMLGNEAVARGAYEAGVQGGIQLSGHAKHGDYGVLRCLFRNRLRMGPQRKGGCGNGLRRRP